MAGNCSAWKHRHHGYYVLRAGRPQQLLNPSLHEPLHCDRVRVVRVDHSHHRQSTIILDRGVQLNTIGLHRQIFTQRGDGEVPVVVSSQKILESLAPRGHALGQRHK